MAEVCDGVVWSWWAEFAGAVRSVAAVVLEVLRERRMQMLFTEDQQSVGEFGSDGAHEPFGKAVRPQAARGSLDYADADIGEVRIERGGELAGPVPDEEPEFGEAIAEVPQQVAGLLSGPRPVRVRGRAQQVHVPAGRLPARRTRRPV